MIGTIVNTATVAIGSCIGIALKKNIPERYQSVFFQVVGLITLSLGFSMIGTFDKLIFIIFSLVIGTLLGTWWNIEGKIEEFGNYMKRHMNIGNERFSEGLITAFLLFCVGSLTFLGTIQEGTGISSDLLYTKSVLDGFSSIILASTFGVSILFVTIPLFVFQALLTLLAMQLSGFFTAEIINGITTTGGVMLIGLGINMLKIKKIPVANMLPALLLTILFLFFEQL